MALPIIVPLVAALGAGGGLAYLILGKKSAKPPTTGMPPPVGMIPQTVPSTTGPKPITEAERQAQFAAGFAAAQAEQDAADRAAGFMRTKEGDVFGPDQFAPPSPPIDLSTTSTSNVLNPFTQATSGIAPVASKLGSQAQSQVDRVSSQALATGGSIIDAAQLHGEWAFGDEYGEDAFGDEWGS